jgi:hypothetical protein
MNLNDKQKEYLYKINLPIESNDRLKDINTFFELFGNIKEHLEGFQWVVGYGKSNELDFIDRKIFEIQNEYGCASLTLDNSSLIFVNTLQTFYDALYFVELIDVLEKNKLLAFIDKEPNELKEFKVPVLEETRTVGLYEWHLPFYKLWILIKDFVLVEFAPMPELNEFIKNGFKTKEEIKMERDLEISIKSLNSYKWFSICALVISIILGAINLISYTTERSVSITNDLNKYDTNKVIIINKENIKQDSISDFILIH